MRGLLTLQTLNNIVRVLFLHEHLPDKRMHSALLIWITILCQGTDCSDLKVNFLTSLAMTFLFHTWCWLCLGILSAAGDHYPVRMFSPLWHSLLIIVLFSLDKALRNFPVFSPSILSPAWTATERIWGLTPESPASWILETVGSKFKASFQGGWAAGIMRKARAWEPGFAWRPSRERQ